MSTMENEIIGMIAKRVRSAEAAPVTLGSTLDELGLESLDVIEMAFDLEEQGLQGSAHFAAHPPRPFAQQAPETPKVDVEALTDDVMRSIDRRIVAYRERTGRV